MSSVKKTTTSQNKFHRPALKKMEALEKRLVPVPDMIPKLSHMLNLRVNQCVYCECYVDSWNNRGVEGDEVYPCTMPGIRDGPITVNGRYNEMNKYTCCTECNSSKNQKVDEKFTEWVERGGNTKGRKIPLPSRQRIIDWYQMSKYWITTDDPQIIREMTNLYTEIQSSRPVSPPTPKPEKVFTFNDELITLFELHDDKTPVGLAKTLGVASSNIYQWKGYKNQKRKTPVPPAHHKKIKDYFKM